MTKDEAILAFLSEADRFAGEALVKYIHKPSMFATELSIDDVYNFQQKVDIIRKMIKEKSNVKQQTKR